MRTTLLMGFNDNTKSEETAISEKGLLSIGVPSLQLFSDASQPIAFENISSSFFNGAGAYITSMNHTSSQALSKTNTKCKKKCLN